MSSTTGARTYRSELRAEQAERTRRRILVAAAEQFSQHGFQATTMAAIARAARVSTETVKAAGSKSELLIRAFEVMFAGTEGADSLADSELAAGALALPDDALLPAVVELVGGANAGSHRLWTVLLGASLSDPLVDDALQVMLANRRRDFVMLVAELVRRGVADPGIDVDHAAAELSFVFSPEGYQQLVGQSGWTETAYRTWLATAARRALTHHP